MDDRIHFITHKDKQILLIDFTDATVQQMLLLLEYVQITIAKHGRDTVLTLADFKGAQVDRTVATRMKEVLTLDRPFVKKSAWVGTENLPRVFYENFQTFSQREFPTFNSREEAMDWLVED